MNSSRIEGNPGDVAIAEEQEDERPALREEQKCPAQPKKSNSKSKRSYVPVELQKREELVRIIEEEKITIKDAAA